MTSVTGRFAQRFVPKAKKELLPSAGVLFPLLQYSVQLVQYSSTNTTHHGPQTAPETYVGAAVGFVSQ